MTEKEKSLMTCVEEVLQMLTRHKPNINQSIDKRVIRQAVIEVGDSVRIEDLTAKAVYYDSNSSFAEFLVQYSVAYEFDLISKDNQHYIDLDKDYLKIRYPADVIFAYVGTNSKLGDYRYTKIISQDFLGTMRRLIGDTKVLYWQNSKRLYFDFGASPKPSKIAVRYIPDSIEGVSDDMPFLEADLKDKVVTQVFNRLVNSMENPQKIA